MGTESQAQVQHQRAVFHQQVTVASGPVDHLYAGIAFAQAVENRGGDSGRADLLLRWAQGRHTGVLFCGQRIRIGQADSLKAQGVAGL